MESKGDPWYLTLPDERYRCGLGKLSSVTLASHSLRGVADKADPYLSSGIIAVLPKPLHRRVFQEMHSETWAQYQSIDSFKYACSTLADMSDNGPGNYGCEGGLNVDDRGC